MPEEKSLGTFEKYLAGWVAACMALGLVLSQTIPGISTALNAWQIRGISVPIGICLFLMMYPALLNLQLSELRKLMENPKPIMLTIFSNWVVAPIVTVLLARYFLAGHDQLIVSLILLGSSPCTAMVFVWGSLADGNQEQNVVNTSLNTITIMFLYAPIVSLLTGIQNIPIDRELLFLSVLVFIGAPMLLGYLSKRYLVDSRGEEWFNETYKPAVGKISMVALLIVMGIVLLLVAKNWQRIASMTAPGTDTHGEVDGLGPQCFRRRILLFLDIGLSIGNHHTGFFSGVSLHRNALL